jgi:phosphatidylinositol alpha-1,6-mannosyltransferase
MEVSTVAADGAQEFDRGESYPIHRQPFPFAEAKRFTRQLQWSRWLTRHSRGNVDALHCGNIRPVGYAVTMSHLRLGIPYFLYVNGGDLLKELQGIRTSYRKRAGARRIIGRASGIVATSQWVADLAGELVQQLRVHSPPSVKALGLGTDPGFFHPHRDRGVFRNKWKIGNAPLIITVARLVPHKGQDIVLQALPALLAEFPTLRYAIIGTGVDEKRLRELAAKLRVTDSVIFAGSLSDSELADAYATSALYVGLSRVENSIDAEGFGISFLEAAASGVPSVAGDSGGIPSAVRHGESGMLVDPTDVRAAANCIRSLLLDSSRRTALGRQARWLVETYYNWDRVAADTRNFTSQVVDSTRANR